MPELFKASVTTWNLEVPPFQPGTGLWSPPSLLPCLMGFAGGGGRDGAWLPKTVTALPLLSHQRRVLSHGGGLRGSAGDRAGATSLSSGQGL